MERVAFLIEETNERVACLLNPESLIVRRQSGVRQRRVAGGVLTGADLADDALLFTGGGTTEMFLDLLFDVALADSSAAQETIKDVRNLTAPLWRLSENSAGKQSDLRNYGQPVQVRFVWGKSWNVPGVIAAVSERLDYFDSSGVPLRSWLKIRFLRVVESSTANFEDQPPPLVLPPETDSSIQNTQDLTNLMGETNGETQVHQYVAGERLDQLVQQQYGFYGHPALWRWLAAYNGVADPLHIAPGTVLRFPPLSVLEGKR